MRYIDMCFSIYWLQPNNYFFITLFLLSKLSAYFYLSSLYSVIRYKKN